MSYFENLKNSLEALNRQSPFLVKKLIHHQLDQKNGPTQFSTGSQGELNLKIEQDNQNFYLHDPANVLGEIKLWTQSLPPFKQIQVVYGSGLGYSYLYLKKWLEEDPDRLVIYLESHLSVLFHLFQTDIGLKMALHPQLQFYSFENDQELEFLLQYLAAYLTSYKVDVATLPSYEKHYPKTSKQLSSRLIALQTLLSTRIIETKTSSPQVFSNFFKKLPILPKQLNFSKLHNTFKDIPCIICAAGPSLDKDLHHLENLSSKALILAGSSAIPALNQAGIEPHMGSFFDPFPRLHERSRSSTAFEMPTIHCARTYHQTSNEIHGPALYTKGSDDLPLVDWMENALGLYGSQIKEYISVTTYNTCIALHLGCNPIIYVGLDLAYTNNRSYSSHFDESKLDDTHLEEAETFKYNEDYWAKDLKGDPVLTRKGWEVEASFLADITSLSQKTSFYNATEAGLGIIGVKNTSLEKLLENELIHSYPIEEKIHAYLQEIKMTGEKLDDPYSISQTFFQSLKRCKAIYKNVLSANKKLIVLNQKGSLKELKLDYVQNALEKLNRELAYQYYLTHHHQVVDIEHLKTHRLFQTLRPNSPKNLVYEIELRRLEIKFNQYLQQCMRYIHFLDKWLINYKKDDVK